MGISMFSAVQSPIAIDFGSSSVKVLQVGTGARPDLIAAAELAIPEAIARNQSELTGYLGRELPQIIRVAGFKGKKVVCSLPCVQTFIQHMQIGAVDGVGRDELVKAQLQTQFGCSPDGVVVRAVEVCEVVRGDQTRTETICFAISRDAVMRHVELLSKAKFDVVGVHTEILALARAFDHIHDQPGHEKLVTMFLDIGYGGTKVAITHGRKLVFARCIQIGGRNFDQCIADAGKCDLTAAKSRRLPGGAVPVETKSRSKAAAGGGTATLERPATDATQSVGEYSTVLDSIADELSMCMRYHQSLFPARSIDRIIFLGGESRSQAVCRAIAGSVRHAAQLGEPLTRVKIGASPSAVGVKLDQPQPGWAVALGLCSATGNE